MALEPLVFGRESGYRRAVSEEGIMTTKEGILMEKEKRYEDIPAYNQETQYVVEREPVDMGEYIFIGLEVKDMEMDTNPTEMNAS